MAGDYAPGFGPLPPMQTRDLHPGETLSSYAQSVTGRNVDPAGLVSQRYDQQIDEQHKALTAKLAEAMKASADFRAKVLVPAGATDIVPEFDYYVTEINTKSGPTAWELIEPLWNDLSMWWWAFAHAQHWKEVEADSNATLHYLQRVRRDGTPPHTNIDPTWPVPGRLVEGKDNVVHYDWDGRAGNVYRGQIDRQIEAVAAIGTTAALINDAVGPVATFTAFLAAAAVAAFAALLALVGDWVLAVFTVERRTVAVFAEIEQATAQAATLAQRMRALPGWQGAAAYVPSYIVEAMAATLRLLVAGIRRLWQFVRDNVVKILQELKKILTGVVNALFNYGITQAAANYAFARATEQLRNVNAAEDTAATDRPQGGAVGTGDRDPLPQLSVAFANGHWPNPCTDVPEFPHVDTQGRVTTDTDTNPATPARTPKDYPNLTIMREPPPPRPARGTKPHP
ncbi:MAG: hypothetical protein V7603_6402 [Micromonosporaceae bacterium]